MDVMSETVGAPISGSKKGILKSLADKVRGRKKKKKKNGTAKQVGGEFAKGIDALARIRGRTKLPD
jgi:hypothetical protein